MEIIWVPCRQEALFRPDDILASADETVVQVYRAIRLIGETVPISHSEK